MGASAQRIVVDTATTSKYLIKPESNVVKKDTPQQKTAEEVSFGDRALSIGKGIINRLKARLNLEEAAESIKGKKDKLLGNKEEEEDAQKKEEGDN